MPLGALISGEFSDRLGRICPQASSQLGVGRGVGGAGVGGTGVGGMGVGGTGVGGMGVGTDVGT